MTKILIVDIETAPNIAYVWGAWKQNIGVKMMMENGYLMSYAAKWLDNDKIFYNDNRHNNDKKIIKELVKLYDEADIVIAHNGVKFDSPTIMGRALIHGIAPPSPYKQVDTLLVARREFRFVHNSLEALAKSLKVSEKLAHKKFPGFDLWLQCLKGNADAWEEMKVYNIQDIVTLEEVYLKMRPWVRSHPNVAAFEMNEKSACPKCGSDHIQYRGYYHTATGMRYRRVHCQTCWGWSRERTNDMPKEVKKGLLTNAV